MVILLLENVYRCEDAIKKVKNLTLPLVQNLAFLVEKQSCILDLHTPNKTPQNSPSQSSGLGLRLGRGTCFEVDLIFWISQHQHRDREQRQQA